MRKETHSSGSNENTKPTKQRALVLQGGGTLGAYEAGVLEGLNVLLRRRSYFT